MKSRQVTSNAFTLVEVLATMALIAIVLPTAMRGIALSTRMASHARHRIEAVSLAKSRLSEMVASGQWTGSGKSGTFGSDRSEYEWSASVTDSTVASVYRLDVTVSWRVSANQTPRSVTLSTFVWQGGR